LRGSLGHAVALALIGAVLVDPLETIAPSVLAVAALAGAAHLPRLNRPLQGAVVAAGLLCASVGLVALWHGATTAWCTRSSCRRC
jgi:hypothetical protein